MRNVELWVEGRQLDVDKVLSAQLSFAVDDVKDFTAKNTAYSKTINIPGSANNNQLFGFIYELDIQGGPWSANAPNIGANFNAGKAADCVLYIDSIQVIKGVLRLMQVNCDNFGSYNYQCYITGELGGLISALGSKKIRGNIANPSDDISLGYQHVWDASVVSGSWPSAGAGTGYIYPLVDYGQVSTGAKITFDIRAFRPAPYVYEVLKQIMEKAGYTFTSPFFERPLFKSLILPNTQDALYINSNNVAYGFTATRFNNFLDLTHSTRTVPFDPSVSRLYNCVFASGATVINYTGPTIQANITANFSYEYNNNSSRPLEVGVKINGLLQFRAYQTLATTSGSHLSGSLTLSPGIPFTINNGDNIELYASFAPGGANVNMTSAYLSIVATTQQKVKALVGDTVSPDSALPQDMTQKDFFGAILKMFNLYCVEDKDNRKNLIITPYPEFYNRDTSSFLDWSAKADANGKRTIKPMSELNARYYNFLYAEDSDYWNEYYKNKYGISYGSRQFDTGFDFGEDKKEIKLPFAGSPIREGGGKFFTPMYKQDGSGVEQVMTCKPRIMQVKHITGVTTYNIVDGATILGAYTDYAFAGHYDDPANPAIDIGFGAPSEVFYAATSFTGDNLFNTYYSSYMAEVISKDSKLLTARFNLNLNDIYQLDFSRLILVDGVLYRLNKIKDYEVGEARTTEVELLKVMYLNG